MVSVLASGEGLLEDSMRACIPCKECIREGQTKGPGAIFYHNLLL